MDPNDTKKGPGDHQRKMPKRKKGGVGSRTLKGPNAKSPSRTNLAPFINAPVSTSLVATLPSATRDQLLQKVRNQNRTIEEQRITIASQKDMVRN